MRIVHPTEIRSLRSKSGLTQAELAESAGITQAYIARIESGDADPKVSTLEKISKALKKALGEEKITAGKIMARPIISVSPGDRVRKSIDLMEVHDISQIPVLEGERQVGSLAEETMVHKISTGGNLTGFLEKKVKEVMDDPFPTVGPEADTDTVLSLLESSPAVLVLEDGNPEGIITKADILQFPRL